MCFTRKIKYKKKYKKVKSIKIYPEPNVLQKIQTKTENDKNKKEQN